jgi:hypothetical protein
MNDAAERRLVPALLRLLAVPIDRVHHDIAAAVVSIPAGLIAIADHLSRLGVQLRMRRKGWAEDLSLKVIASNRLERLRIHRIGWPVLLGRQEHAPPKYNIRVRRRADHALDRLVIRIRIPIFPKQAPPLLLLVLEPIRAHVALLEVCPTVLDADGGHVAVAVEVDVRVVERWEAVVGLHAEEGAFDVRRDRARHLEILHVAFDAGGGVETRKGLGLGELHAVVCLDAVGVERRGGPGGLRVLKDVRHCDEVGELQIKCGGGGSKHTLSLGFSGGRGKYYSIKVIKVYPEAFFICLKAGLHGDNWPNRATSYPSTYSLRIPLIPLPLA